MVSVGLPHPSHLPNIEPPPLRTASPMICPVLSMYPDEFIPNTKVVRNTSTTPDTSPSRVSDVHDTSGMTPPPDTLSGNHLEPVFHPRMNSCSELIAMYYVRASIAFLLSCNTIFFMISLYLLFLPPSLIVW